MTLKYFLIGLGIGIVGAILWVIASLVAGVGAGLGGKVPTQLYVLMIIGFLAMIGGPLTFWIIFPIRRHIKKRRAAKDQVKC